MHIRSTVAALSLVALAACASSPSAERPAAALAAEISHDVFFTFSEPTGAAVEGLIAACERLRDLPGVVHLTAGPRDPSQTREVNETSFHVALHVEFANQASYDAYGPHPTHQALVSEFIPLTSAVVVYDALLRR